MSIATFATDLTAWALQSALLLGVGLLLPSLFRLREPRACLVYGQGLLLAALLLPLGQSLRPQAVQMGFTEEMRVPGRWIGQLVASGSGGGDTWSLSHLLLLGLGVGAALRLAWLGMGLFTLRSYLRGARPVEMETWIELFEEVGAEARLLLSPRVEIPVTFGWRRPVILLPAGFASLPADAQRGIVCHELLHVRRRDWLFALGEEGVRALLWFHPAVWLLLARITLSREQVIDREVVRLTGSRRAYLEALRSVACRSWQTGLTEVPGLPFFHQGHLRERVVHLCKEVPMSRPRVTALVSTFACLLALTAVFGTLAFPMAGAAWAATEPTEPLQIEGDIRSPEILHRTEPIYPESAKKDKLAGTAIVQIVIDKEGKVQDPAVKSSSGHDVLDKAVLEALPNWTFKPATLHGEPVAVKYFMVFKFDPDEE